MSHLAIAPVLLPLLAGIALLLGRRLDIRWRRAFSLAAVLGQILLAAALLQAVSGGAILTYALGNWPAPYGIVLVADRLAVWMLLVTALLALFALLHACRGIDVGGRDGPPRRSRDPLAADETPTLRYSRGGAMPALGQPGDGHFHVLFQLQLCGLNGAFLTGDLFNLFVFFEVLLLASYGLVLHGGGRHRTRAGLHYVVLNLAGSALFLIAVGTLYGLFGTLNMADLALKMAAVPAENLGPARAAGLLLFAVFALKAALLPLHLWLPAAYGHTSAPVAALFAIMTKVGVYAILRVSTLIFGAQAGSVNDPLACKTRALLPEGVQCPPWDGPAVGMSQLIEPWLLPLALCSLLVGLFGALAARGLREQAAYLVVASVGTLLTAFALGSVAGIAAGLYYLPHSVFAAAALFLLAERIAQSRGEPGDGFEPAPAMAGAPLLGGLFFVTAILLAGLPPLSGFLGKFLLLQAALAHPHWPWIMAVVLLGGLLAVIALARAGSLLFFRVLPLEEGAAAPVLAADLPLTPLLGLLALAILLAVGAGPIHALATATAEQLLQPYHYVHAVLGGRP